MSRGMRMVSRCALALATVGCTTQVAGTAVRVPGERPGPPPLVNVGELMLDLPRMRGITGGGNDLTIIPSMDSPYPVDIDLLAADAPPPCRFLFAETATFGSDLTDFHKTTYQQPPIGGIISQGAAAYRDPAAAHHALDTLARAMDSCAQTPFGAAYVGEVSIGPDTLRMRPGNDCGRDYRIKYVVLVEVTFCGFPESVPEIVLTNLLAEVPG